MKFLPLSLTLLGAGLLATAQAASTTEAKQAGGAGKPPATDTTGPKLTSEEEAFVKKASAGNLAEVKLGELAKDKAMSPEVKEFGAKMAADHSKANDDLQAVAEKKGAKLPAELMGNHKMTFERMSKLSGAAFDKAYVQDMVMDHKKDVAEYTSASKSVKDDELKGYVDKTLPTLKEHLEMIEKLSKEQMTKKK